MLDATPQEVVTGLPVQTLSSRRAGAIQAVNIRGLVHWATKNNYVVVMSAAVGDFVTREQPLIAVFSGGGPGKRANGSRNADRRLQGMLALGVERTVEDDPAFAMRIIVDIAVKALSSAINDPTTAVQALDHLGDVLRVLGSTPLHKQLGFRGRDGATRLLMPGRTWDDYLTLGVTEIRECGSTSLQVMRRLRALLDDLKMSVLPEHRDAVLAEIMRLDGTVASGFGKTVDKDLAEAQDRQGIGGPARWLPGSTNGRPGNARPDAAHQM